MPQLLEVRVTRTRPGLDPVSKKVLWEEQNCLISGEDAAPMLRGEVENFLATGNHRYVGAAGVTFNYALVAKA